VGAYASQKERGLLPGTRLDLYSKPDTLNTQPSTKHRSQLLQLWCQLLQLLQHLTQQYLRNDGPLLLLLPKHITHMRTDLARHQHNKTTTVTT
jgi:hypothetical protein